jgi:hypothetical protein
VRSKGPCAWREPPILKWKFYRISTKSSPEANKGNDLVHGGDLCVFWRASTSLNLPPVLNLNIARYENFIPKESRKP